MLMTTAPNGRLPEAQVAPDEQIQTPKPFPVVDLEKLRSMCKRWLHEAAVKAEKPADFSKIMEARTEELVKITAAMGVTTDDVRAQLIAIEGTKQDAAGLPRETYGEMKVAARNIADANPNTEQVTIVTRTIAEVCANYEARYLAALPKKKAVADASAKTAIKANGAKTAVPVDDFDALAAEAIGKPEASASSNNDMDFDLGPAAPSAPIGDVSITVDAKPKK